MSITVEGIPPADLKEWKRKKEIEAGIAAGSIDAPAQVNRNKIDLGVIPQDELRRKLATHKDMMEGKIAPSAVLGLSGPAPAMAPPPFAMPGMSA